MRAALDSMEDPILHLAVHLTLVGALREGEIVGLTPEDLDFDATDGIGTFRADPQKVPQVAGCTPRVPAYRIPRPAAFQCHLSADDFRRRCEGRSRYHRTRYGRYADEHLKADRADPDFSGYINGKERQILRFNALLLVHLQGLEPWAH